MKEHDFSFIVQLTARCNLDCVYCFEDSKFAFDMKENTLESLFKSVLGFNKEKAHFGFLGGEALLVDEGLFDLIPSLQKRYNVNDLDVSNSIQTNGIKLTESLESRLKNLGYKLGVSYDGCFDITTNLRTRSDKKTFLIEENLSRNGKGVITVLTKESVGREEEIFNNLKKYTKAAQLNLFEKLGNGKNADLTPSTEEATSMMLKFYELWKADTTGFHLEPFVGMVRSFVSRNNNICEFSSDSCSKIIYVDVFGNYRFCSRAPLDDKYKLGNVFDTSLTELNVKKEILEERMVAIKKSCDCNFYELCQGGCAVSSPTFNEPTNYCGLRKELFNKINEDIYGQKKD